MGYREFDIDLWNRKEHFLHFTKEVNCSCCLTANIDITKLEKAIQGTNISFYIAFLYCVCKVVNAHEEFRLCYRWQDDKVIIWDEVNPSHIIFHKGNNTFTRIWSKWNSDFNAFYRSCRKDVEEGQQIQGYSIPDVPENVFDVSCLPWIHYSAMNLVVPKDWIYLAPIITWGKFTEDGDKTILPLTMQIHHAAADGFHISRFFAETEKVASELADCIIPVHLKESLDERFYK